MKRLILSLAAAAALAAPVAAVATSAQADPYGHHDNGRHNGWDNDRGRWDHGDRNYGRWDHGDRDYGRWDRGHDDWSRGRHNGYYYQNRWYYGPPPQAYYGNPYYRPGYTSWRRGSVLPSYYRGYVVHDYYRYHLRPPPRGYAWYRAGDDYLLAAVASGLIFEIIANDY
jgi:Ni/Co efflux regulator RcnB